MRLAYPILILSVVVACDPFVPDMPVAARLEAALQRGDDTVIRVRDVTEFQWDRFFAFGPYTPCSEIEKTLGFEWKDCQGTGIEMSDAFDLLVFVAEQTIIRVEELGRRNGGFAEESLDRAFTPSSAVFVVRKSREYPQLFPAAV